jgi:4-amino-4-deoxy-L-arabinose transferase-like glycosyltransferase
MKPGFSILILLAALTVLRWMWNIPWELSPDEAYLALCGFSPAIAYFDGPPGTAISVALGIRLAGANGLGASLLWPLFAFAASLALYQLTALMNGHRAALAITALLNLVPAFNQAAVTPSCFMPLAMFGLGFMACTWRAVETKLTVWWIAAGLCAAGGLLLSYLAWFFLPAIGVALLASHRWRHLLIGKGFWIALLPPLAVLALLLWWNAQNGWIHFIGGTWQTALTLEWLRFPSGIVDASIALSPLVFLAIEAGLVVALRESHRTPRAKFLTIPAMTTLLIAGYQLLQGESAYASGMLAACLSLPLLAWFPANLTGITRRTALTIVFASAALWTGTIFALHNAPQPLVSAPVGRALEKLRAAQPAESPLFLIAQNAPLASALALQLADISNVPPGHPPVYVVESPYADSQFALWPRYDQFVETAQTNGETADDPFTEQKGANLFLGRTALYITTQNPNELPQALTAAFASHRHLAEITTPSGMTLHVYLCSDYETLPL